MCRSIGEGLMNPVNEVKLHIQVVDFGDTSLLQVCAEGWAEIDESYARIV